jgi:hypothetical protein
MNRKTGREQPSLKVASSAVAGSENFDFELWASEVKRQMLAALRKTQKV